MPTPGEDEPLRRELRRLKLAVGLLSLVSIAATAVGILAISQVRRLDDVIRVRRESTNLVADRILTRELLVVPFPKETELRDYKQPKLPTPDLRMPDRPFEPTVAMRPGHLVVHGAGWGRTDELVFFPATIELRTGRGAEAEVRPDTSGKNFILRTLSGRAWTLTDSSLHAAAR